MPTFKHPCPYCGKFIDRAVAACPYCSQPDPFAPRRCQNCRKIVEDAAWVTCAFCGASLNAKPADAAAGQAAGSGGAAQSASPRDEPASQVAVQRPPLYVEPNAPEPAPQPAGKCSGCGAPMGAGARFCTICGTMAG